MKIEIIFSMFLILTSCGYSNTKVGEGNESGGNSNQNTSGVPGGLDFASVRAQVFEPNCFLCHSAARGNRAGLNLETYANVKAKLGSIQSRIRSGSMPPSGPLSANVKNILDNWIAAGAPEIASVAGGANPAPAAGGPGGGSTPPSPPTQDCDEHDFVRVEADLYFDTKNEILRRGGRCDDDGGHHGGGHH